jgi:hypothetical protein
MKGSVKFSVFYNGEGFPYEDATVFESCYHENLQMDVEEKKAVLTHSIAVLMNVDGELIGEAYGCPTDKMEEEIEDTVKDQATMYCYSNTILPSHQHMGWGKILKAFWLGVVKAKGFTKVVGHTNMQTGSDMLNKFFGCRFGKIHKDWYATKVPYCYYEISL